MGWIWRRGGTSLTFLFWKKVRETFGSWGFSRCHLQYKRQSLLQQEVNWCFGACWSPSIWVIFRRIKFYPAPISNWYSGLCFLEKPTLFLFIPWPLKLQKVFGVHFKYICKSCQFTYSKIRFSSKNPSDLPIIRPISNSGILVFRNNPIYRSFLVLSALSYM